LRKRERGAPKSKKRGTSKTQVHPSRRARVVRRRRTDRWRLGALALAARQRLRALAPARALDEESGARREDEEE